MEMRKIIAYFLLYTVILYAEICMTSSVVPHIGLFKPEIHHMIGYLLFTDENWKLRCNHEPGEQIDIWYHMPSTTGVLPSKIVIASSLNKTYTALFKLENYLNYSDLTVPDPGNIANGSVFECVGRTSLSSSSLEIFVQTPIYWSVINSTSYSLQTSGDIVIKPAEFCCCHLVVAEQNRSHPAIVQCKFEISDSCPRFITVSLSLVNNPNVETRTQTLEPFCSNVDQQNSLTTTVESQKMDVQDGHTGEPSKGTSKSPEGWIMIIMMMLASLVILYQ